jgi:hypothetical protein
LNISAFLALQDSKMPRTFNYKDASKHNHKMASKYASYQDDEEAWKSYTGQNWTEPFSITNGHERAWMNLTKAELMTIPWMKEAIETPDAKLFIDDCLGFDIKDVSEGGSIRLKNAFDWTPQRCLRIAKNTVKPSRLQLTEYYRDDDGLWQTDPNYPRRIFCATVSKNFGGFCFSEGPNKYYYHPNGEITTEFLCYLDDKCFGYCCFDECGGYGFDDYDEKEARRACREHYKD